MAIFFIMVVRSSLFLLLGISIMVSVDSRWVGDSTDDSSKKKLVFSDGDALVSGVFKVMAVEGDRRDDA